MEKPVWREKHMMNYPYGNAKAAAYLTQGLRHPSNTAATSAIPVASPPRGANNPPGTHQQNTNTLPFLQGMITEGWFNIGKIVGQGRTSRQGG
jgi:hypothetical protein